MFRHLLVTFAVLSVVGFALALADEESVWQNGDDEIVLSNMPLSNVRKMDFADGEHQANDLSTVLVIGIEVCNGTPL